MLHNLQLTSQVAQASYSLVSYFTFVYIGTVITILGDQQHTETLASHHLRLTVRNDLNFPAFISESKNLLLLDGRTHSHFVLWRQTGRKSHSETLAHFLDMPFRACRNVVTIEAANGPVIHCDAEPEIDEGSIMSL